LSLQKALEEELSSLAGFTDKVFPVVAPQDDDEPIAAPYILYEAGYGVEEKALGGFLNLREVECELNVMTATYSSLKTNVAAIIERLKSFERRAIGSDALFISELTYNAPVELYEPLPKLYRCVIEFTVHY